jgi:hypothetical protein
MLSNAVNFSGQLSQRVVAAAAAAAATHALPSLSFKNMFSRGITTSAARTTSAVLSNVSSCLKTSGTYTVAPARSHIKVASSTLAAAFLLQKQTRRPFSMSTFS